MATTKITNVSGTGPRGVETPSGTVYVEPGETVEVELLTKRADGSEIPLYEGLEIGEGPAKKVAAAKKDAAEEPAEK